MGDHSDGHDDHHDDHSHHQAPWVTHLVLLIAFGATGALVALKLVVKAM